MGFYNIFIEGQQAEEYKARKAKEAEEKEKAEAERLSRRTHLGTGDKHSYASASGYKSGEMNPDITYDKAKTDRNRSYNALKVSHRDSEDRLGKYLYSHKDEIEKDLASLEKEYNAASAAGDKAKMEEIDAKADALSDQYEKKALGPGGGYDMETVNRHMRRHPDQWDGDKRIKTRSESGIFESVEFLND